MVQHSAKWLLQQQRRALASKQAWPAASPNQGSGAGGALINGNEVNQVGVFQFSIVTMAAVTAALNPRLKAGETAVPTAAAENFRTK